MQLPRSSVLHGDVTGSATALEAGGRWLFAGHDKVVNK